MVVLRCRNCRPSHEGRGLKLCRSGNAYNTAESPFSRRARIETGWSRQPPIGKAGRPSHEGRGLKHEVARAFQACRSSPFSRRARIETRSIDWTLAADGGRPSHEGRGLKLVIPVHDDSLPRGRPSHEGRGLKPSSSTACHPTESRPSHEGRGLKRYGHELEINTDQVALLTKGED